MADLGAQQAVGANTRWGWSSQTSTAFFSVIHLLPPSLGISFMFFQNRMPLFLNISFHNSSLRRGVIFCFFRKISSPLETGLPESASCQCLNRSPVRVVFANIPLASGEEVKWETEGPGGHVLPFILTSFLDIMQYPDSALLYVRQVCHPVTCCFKPILYPVFCVAFSQSVLLLLFVLL